MRSYFVSLIGYSKETAHYFMIATPLILTWVLIESSLLISDGVLVSLSWYEWLILIYLMKEVSYWMFVKEHQILSEIVLKTVRPGRVDRIQHIFGNVRNMIFFVRGLSKICSWLFMFILLATFFRVIGETVSHYSIAIMGIIFYFSMELRTLLKAAYLEHTIEKVKEVRKSKTNKMVNKKR
ncbi:hypothetical protein ABD91_25675 [Lysinibacillus sphaericus]|nr:hypothetical protein [Lysinibacillus sphaericus]